MQIRIIRRILAAIVVLLAALCLVGYIAGMRVTLNPARQLADARARWAAQAIDDYTLLVQVEAPFSTSGIYELDVQNGIVTAASVYNPPTFRYDPNAPAFELPPSQGEPYTVAALFTQAARLQDRLPRVQLYLPTSTHVRYDEAGYVTELVDNACGWALNLTPECLTRIEIVRLER